MQIQTLFVFVFLFETVFSQTCKRFGVKEEYLNKRLVGHALYETSAAIIEHCVGECMCLSRCKSTDYNTTHNTCKLNDVNSASVDSSEFLPLSGAIFSDISDWPDTMVARCGPRPCAPNQRCVPTINAYACLDITCKKNHFLNDGKIQLTEPGKNKLFDVATVVCDKGYVPSRPTVTCKATGKWETATCLIVTDCKDIVLRDPDAASGVYDIQLWNSKEILKVYCDMETDGGGWTLFQRRFNGLVDFYRNFDEYENGFGTMDTEFWLGLKYIKELAEQGPTELRLDMSKTNGNEGYETFQDFSLAENTYALSIGSRTGNTGNASNGLNYNNGHSFSTFDVDLDVDLDGRNCAEIRQGAWWYRYCTYVNLNGPYKTPGTYCSSLDCVTHYAFNELYTLKTTKMMLRRK